MVEDHPRVAWPRRTSRRWRRRTGADPTQTPGSRVHSGPRLALRGRSPAYPVLRRTPAFGKPARSPVSPGRGTRLVRLRAAPSIHRQNTAWPPVVAFHRSCDRGRIRPCADLYPDTGRVSPDRLEYRRQTESRLYAPAARSEGQPDDATGIPDRCQSRADQASRRPNQG